MTRIVASLDLVGSVIMDRGRRMPKIWPKFDLLRLFDTALPIDQGSNEILCKDLVKIGAYTKVCEYVYVK